VVPSESLRSPVKGLRKIQKPMTLEHQQDCETKVANDLDDREYRLITCAVTVNDILERFGINHDNSAVLEDSYHAIFTNGDEYWGCHKATPLVSSTVYRIQ
jgi:uncharacterized protein YabE (DUF348 family)